MEDQNLNQGQSQEERIEPKIRLSRDGKWIIIRIPGVEQPVIKAVAYFEKILERAKSIRSDAGSNYGVEKIK